MKEKASVPFMEKGWRDGDHWRDFALYSILLFPMLAVGILLALAFGSREFFAEAFALSLAVTSGELFRKKEQLLNVAWKWRIAYLLFIGMVVGGALMAVMLWIFSLPG